MKRRGGAEVVRESPSSGEPACAGRGVVSARGPRPRSWTDQALECVECGSPFVIAEGEVDFYALRGLELPRRCAHCRKVRRHASRRP